MASSTSPGPIFRGTFSAYVIDANLRRDCPVETTAPSAAGPQSYLDFENRSLEVDGVEAGVDSHAREARGQIDFVHEIEAALLVEAVRGEELVGGAEVDPGKA